MRRGALAAVAAVMVVASGVSSVAAQPAAEAAAFMLATLAATQSPAGAFDALSAADQKIARALHAAQKSTSVTRSLLTLDQIAFRKRGGLGWGEIFNIMKGHGLVSEKNVTQAVSNYEHAPNTAHAASGGPAAMIPAVGR
jgi:hypothetical protein